MNTNQTPAHLPQPYPLRAVQDGFHYLVLAWVREGSDLVPLAVPEAPVLMPDPFAVDDRPSPRKLIGKGVAYKLPMPSVKLPDPFDAAA